MPCTWGKTTIHNSSALRTGSNTAAAQKKGGKGRKRGQRLALQSLQLPSTCSASSSLCLVYMLSTHWCPCYCCGIECQPFLYNLFPNPLGSLHNHQNLATQWNIIFSKKINIYYIDYSSTILSVQLTVITRHCLMSRTFSSCKTENSPLHTDFLPSLPQLLAIIFLLSFCDIS